MNGLTGIFMVTSVMAVPRPGKLKKDNRSNSHSNSNREETNALFAQALQDASQEMPAVPRECYTTVYGRDSRMQTFQYCSREYHS